MMTYLLIDTSSKDVEFLTALRNPFVLALLISLLLICIVLVLVLITILSKARVTCVAKSNLSFYIEVLSHSDCELSDLD